jgi:UDP-N-acetylglucosamine 4,6-dehydratase
MKLDFLKNKVIFISGATGSFGKNLVFFLLKNSKAKKIIIFSRDELKQHDLKNKIISKNVRYFIGDIRDYDRLNFALKGVDIVIHAAALKHIDIAEYNPFEFIKTNILGCQNLIQACFENKVKSVLALSTDKASSPINLYGATKLISDKLFVSANNYKGSNEIKLSVVRYGNVFGSRGSVIPLFLNQLKTKKLTVTNPEMTRFSITIDDAVKFVVECLDDMLGGEIFVPKLKSYYVKDVVKAISKKTTKIKIVGERPGEKTHEEMISKNDAINTVENKNSYVILPNSEFNSLNVRNYLKLKKNSIKVLDNFCYNSLDNKFFLSQEEIKKLILKVKIEL